VPDSAARVEKMDGADSFRRARRLCGKDLKAVPARQVDYLNGLYAAGELALKNCALRWTWHTHEPVDHWVRLSSGQDRIWLGLGAARVDPAIDFDWRDCSGDLRLVAWSASFHRVLEALSEAFRRDWMPEAFVSHRELAGRCIQVGFTLTEQQTVTATGRLVIDQQLQPLATGRPIDSDARSQQLPVKVPLTVDRLWLTPNQLQGLVVGSVICIRRSAFLDIGARLVLRLGATTLIAGLAASKLTIVAVNPEPEHSIYSKEITVSEEANESSKTTPSEVGCAPIDIDSMPVELCFHAGHLTTSYAEVRALQPGYVFDLGRRLREQRIDVTANGALIGYGELVAIGEQIGVRLTALGSTNVVS